MNISSKGEVKSEFLELSLDINVYVSWIMLLVRHMMQRSACATDRTARRRTFTVMIVFEELQQVSAGIFPSACRLWNAAAAAADQRGIIWRLLLRTCQHDARCWLQRILGHVLQWHPSRDQHAPPRYGGLMARQPGPPLSAAGPPEWNCAKLLQVCMLAWEIGSGMPAGCLVSKYV